MALQINMTALTAEVEKTGVVAMNSGYAEFISKKEGKSVKSVRDFMVGKGFVSNDSWDAFDKQLAERGLARDGYKGGKIVKASEVKVAQKSNKIEFI